MSNWPKMLRRQVAGSALLEWRKFNSPAEVEAGWSNDELDMMKSTPVSKDWPACRYPPGAGPSAGKVFQRAEDVPEGWTDSPTGDDPVSPPTQEPPKNLQEASMRLARAFDSIALLEAELRAARAANAALQAELDEAKAGIAADAEEGASAPRKRKAAAAE